MIRTGIPFLSKVRASISPTGPAPTYVPNIKNCYIDGSKKKSRTIRTWGGVTRDISRDIDIRYLGLVR